VEYLPSWGYLHSGHPNQCVPRVAHPSGTQFPSHAPCKLQNMSKEELADKTLGEKFQHHKNTTIFL
jgi:hypothetical protein